MGVKVLDPEVRDDVSSSGGRVRGVREFVYPIIPQTDGRFSVPVLELGFFDPGKAEYYVLSTGPLAFTASGAGISGQAADAKSGMRVVGSDIAHIKPSRSTSFSGIPGFSAWDVRPPVWSWALYALGLAMIALGVVFGRHRRRLERDRGYARMRRSNRLVKRRLAEATALLRQGRTADFYAALDRAVLGYIGDRFNIEAHGMTGEELTAELSGRGVPEDTAAGLLELVRTCAAARFSPAAASGCSPVETLETARRILEEL
jgi:hypothetical protein